MEDQRGHGQAAPGRAEAVGRHLLQLRDGRPKREAQEPGGVPQSPGDSQGGKLHALKPGAGGSPVQGVEELVGHHHLPGQLLGPGARRKPGGQPPGQGGQPVLVEGDAAPRAEPGQAEAGGVGPFGAGGALLYRHPQGLRHLVRPGRRPAPAEGLTGRRARLQGGGHPVPEGRLGQGVAPGGGSDQEEARLLGQAVQPGGPPPSHPPSPFPVPAGGHTQPLARSRSKDRRKAAVAW